MPLSLCSDPALEGIRVYVHYPFCATKCPYCAFPTSTDRSVEIDYFDALLSEIDAFRFDRPILSLYFGGGSPSLMDIGYIQKITSKIRRFFAKDIEISIELKPEDCGDNFAQKYSDVGINRFSIGVQSFLPQKLELLKRRPLHHNYYAPKDVVTSFDIIIGTKLDDIFLEQEVQAITELKPNHLSLYPLSLESGSYFYSNIPDFLSTNIGTQYEKYCKQLSQNGYTRYESSNYYLEKQFIFKHGLGYWNNDDVVGFGAASHSKVGLESWQNSPLIEEYIRSVKKCSVDRIDRIVLTDFEYAEQTLLLGLRLTDGVALENLIERAKDEKRLVKKLQLLLDKAYITVENGFIKSECRFNFERCLDILGWHVHTIKSWKTIVPNRLKQN